jgi:hypothetical protein
MPLTSANLETLINLLTALAQRQEAIRQLATQLHSGALWRTPAGDLAVALTTSQQSQLTALATAYLDETEIAVAAARAILAAAQ